MTCTPRQNRSQRCSRAVSRLRLIGAAMMLLASHGVALGQTAPALTIANAVEEALANNPRALNQRDAGTQADLGVRLARNTFSPKVVPNVAGSFGQTNVAN